MHYFSTILTAIKLEQKLKATLSSEFKQDMNHDTVIYRQNVLLANVHEDDSQDKQKLRKQ